MDITVTLPDIPGINPVESTTAAQPAPAPTPSPSPAVDFMDPVGFNEGTDSAASLMQGQDAILSRAAAREHLDRLEAEYGFLQATQDAFSIDTTVGLMMQDKGRPDFAPDPTFTVDHFKDRVKKSMGEGKIPSEYVDRFSSAISDAHYDWIEQNIREDMDKRQKLAELGWKGVGARLLAGALDPGAIAIGLASGGLGAAAAKAAQVGRIGAAAISAASGAAGNVAVEAVLDAEGKPSTAADYLMAGALGAGLGGAVGLLSTSPREAAAMSKILQEQADYILAVANDIAPPARDITPDPMRPFKPTEPLPESLKGSTSLSAAARPGGIDTPFLTKENLEVLTDENVSKTAGMWRYSLAGDLGKSKNPLSRVLGMHMVNDSVGREGHAVNAFPADLEMSRLSEKRTAEFQRTRHGAYETWRERTKAGNDGLIQFDKAVLRLIRTGEAADPEVETTANAFRSSMKEQRLDAQNPGRNEGKVFRPVPGSEDVPEDDGYAWRLLDAAKVNHMVETYGEAEVRRLVRESIFDAQPYIDADILDKLSEGYVRGLRRRAAGIEDDFAHAFTSGNQQRLAEILRTDTGWSDQEIEAVIGAVFPGGKSRTTNLNKRILLNEGYKTKSINRVTGVSDDISFLDLLSDDLNYIHTAYTRRMSGQVALQRVRIANPEFGNVPGAAEFLVDGIADPSEFSRLLAHVREMGADYGQSADEIAKDIFNLKFAYDRLRGVPLDAEMGKFAENLRRLRKFNFARMMSNTGWSMAQEPATLISQLGIKSTFSHFPALRRAITGKMEKSLINDMGRELEALTGLGTDPLRGLEAFRYDEMVGMWETKSGSTAGARVDMWLDKAQRLVANLGMSQMTMITQRWTAKAIVQKIADFSIRNPSSWEYRRMAQLGLDESMTKRIFTEMENHSTFEDGLFFSHKVKRINTEKWTDLEALASFERAIYRYTHKLVQNNDLGSMATWMSHPIAKTILQFRTYNLVAWDNQLQYNLHMRDPAALSYLAINVAFGALIYAVQTQLSSLGRSDRDEYLEKRLSWDKLAAAGFSRASFSSIIPALFDTGALFFGIQPMFDFRSSGQAQNLWFGNPNTGFIFEDAPKAIRGLLNATIGEDEFTQQDLRSMSRTVPLGNWIPVQILLSILSQGVPEKPYNRY